MAKVLTNKEQRELKEFMNKLECKTVQEFKYKMNTFINGYMELVKRGK